MTPTDLPAADPMLLQAFVGQAVNTWPPPSRGCCCTSVTGLACIGRWPAPDPSLQPIWTAWTRSCGLGPASPMSAADLGGGGTSVQTSGP